MTDFKGAFFDSLTRNNSEIKKDRATAISEDAQIHYKRSVEDLELQIKRLKRQQENMLDLSPDNTTSLKLANNFDALQYVNQDLHTSIMIRQLEIKLELAQKRYNYLFGGE